MSLYDYKMSIKIAEQDYPFYALIMAAMRQADSENIVRLRCEFQDTWEELQARYNSPGGYLPDEETELVRVTGCDKEMTEEDIKSMFDDKGIE